METTYEKPFVRVTTRQALKSEYLGSVDRPSADRIMGQVRRALAGLRLSRPSRGPAIVWAKETYIGDEPVANLYASCTYDEAQMLEEVVATAL